MEVITILITIYILLYVWYIGRLWYGYRHVAPFTALDTTPKEGFSIIVPFRNEEQYLPELLQGFLELDYPDNLIEFIFIDDQSNDTSATIINRWRLANPRFHTTMIDNVRMTSSPKKDAITRSISIAMHQWIVTTDADCTVPKHWLSTLNDFIRQRDAKMICGPVAYRKSMQPLSIFQQTDLLALQAATIGGFGLGDPFMCNAANFTFNKAFFQEIGGFSGVTKQASGDDVFLLQKAFAHRRDNVAYLKSRDAIVTTVPPRTIGDLFMQRVRWGSKAKYYQSELGETVSIIVFFGNLMLLVAMLLSVGGAMPWQIGLGLFSLKFIADYALALRANAFLQQRKLFFPVLSGLAYPAFCTAVGIYSLYGKYTWKGRTLS